jgi:murein L,D-transpeptidase YcbB/YkuD
LGKTTQRDLEVFDEHVEHAVRRFQARHGLRVDGVLGPVTLAALNVSVTQRLQQLRANLERWRWLPRDLGRQHIVVNIARFTLDVVEDAQSVMTMRIIVGTPYRDTPAFSSQINYLVLNPSWNVPLRIAVEDKLPLIRQDPGYLGRNHMKVFQGWGTEAREIDPGTINWSKVSAEKFPYRLRQTPGPLNALGQIKFILPNPFDVYLHDTPSRELFNRTIRTFSSGCIRVEKPLELAQYVLRGDPRWRHESLLATIGRRREQTIRVPVPVPVHILYWTAWVEVDGTVHFRNDIYHRDTLVEQALNTRPPLRQGPPLKEIGAIWRGADE